MLLHGKNFCAATWEGSITALTRRGLSRDRARPDRLVQIHQAATLPISPSSSWRRTRTTLLKSLGIGKAIIMGHSIGGMLAMRYGLTFPADTERLVLVDPLGLEDWRAKGVPWQSLDAQYQTQLKTTADSIREYRAHHLLRRHLEAGI